MLSHEGMLGGCHLPMTNVYRERLENGLEVLYWGLECSVGRFIDVYVLDKRKPLLRGFGGALRVKLPRIRIAPNRRHIPRRP